MFRGGFRLRCVWGLWRASVCPGVLRGFFLFPGAFLVPSGASRFARRFSVFFGGFSGVFRLSGVFLGLGLFRCLPVFLGVLVSCLSVLRAGSRFLLRGRLNGYNSDVDIYI